MNKKKKPKLRYSCWKYGCNKKFSSWQARDKHVNDKVVHPDPKPVMKHVPFADLVGAGTNWGKQKENGKWVNPTDADLTIGFLARIADTLDEILKELRKPRVLK